LKNLPVIIGESDPEGCAACQGEHLGYRNGTMYSSYTAAVFARKHELADQYGVNFEGALTWAFEFEDQPYFAGFRSLATNGIDKPVLNVFRMFSRMSGDRLAVESDGAVPLMTILKEGVRGKPDISAMAAIDKNKLTIMVWHYHDEDLPGPDAQIDLVIEGLSSRFSNAKCQHFRIDRDHSNAYTLWQELGRPQNPTQEQYAQLEKDGQLAQIAIPEMLSGKDGRITFQFKLPRQGVSLLTLETA
jgi:xylan 1,4-beta-xylosidase